MASKADLISDVAEAASVSKSDAESVLGAFFDHVVATAQAGGDTSWPGFGKFSTTQRAARVGRNPQTGAPVDIPASVAMKFSSAAALKAALNGK